MSEMKKDDQSKVKVLILYYSGVGNTERIAFYMRDYLHKILDVECRTIEENVPIDYSMYNALILGFPVIHSEPAKPIMDYISQIERLVDELPVFIFSTCGLYSANAIRLFIKVAKEKNLQPFLNRSYRTKAIDGALLMPKFEYWFRDEKRIEEKLDKDLEFFIEALDKDVDFVVPGIKWYSVLNYPNKQLGKLYRFKIHLHHERCIRCNKCKRKCPVQAIEIDCQGYPVINRNQCINCYRCIHHCPGLALSLSKRKPVNRTFYYNHPD